MIVLNELGKKDKMRGLPSILSLFRNEFNNVLYCIYDVSFVSRCTLYLNKILFTLINSIIKEHEC